MGLVFPSDKVWHSNISFYLSEYSYRTVVVGKCWLSLRKSQEMKFSLTEGGLGSSYDIRYHIWSCDPVSVSCHTGQWLFSLFATKINLKRPSLQRHAAKIEGNKTPFAPKPPSGEEIKKVLCEKAPWGPREKWGTTTSPREGIKIVIGPWAVSSEIPTARLQVQEK